MSLNPSFQISIVEVTLVLFFLHQPFLLLALPVLPQPDPASIQPFIPTQTQNQTLPPTTIPAFPEQSNLAGCPLNLPEELFTSISHACGSGTKIKRTQCCPTLAAWLYSAYSGTALSRAGLMAASPYDLPVLPDDSETCVNNLEQALKGKGIEMRKPNETCDVVFCYCGIRLPPLSCPEAFMVSSRDGKLVGDESVGRLERDCLTRSSNGHGGFSSVAGCSKCLKSLYQLKEEKSGNKTKSTSSSDGRKSKMHNRDCELMGLTWLLEKNRTAYMPTVSAVLRALMMRTDGSDPKSCTVSRDGMPLAVDSAELHDASSSDTSRVYVHLIGIILSLSVIIQSCAVLLIL